jgi:hypothetical protein
MLRYFRSAFLLLVVAILSLPVCSAQSRPQHVRDYIYDPSGRLILTAEPSAYPPGMLPSFSASPGQCASDGISLDWGTATDVGPGIGSYNLYRDGSSIGGFSVTTHEYVDYDITGGSSYTYSVSAVDRAGVESDQTYAGADMPLCINNNVAPGMTFWGRPTRMFAHVNLLGQPIRRPAPIILAARSVRLVTFPHYSQSDLPFNQKSKLVTDYPFGPSRKPKLLAITLPGRRPSNAPILRTTDAWLGGSR